MEALNIDLGMVEEDSPKYTNTSKKKLYESNKTLNTQGSMYRSKMAQDLEDMNLDLG